MLVWRFGRVTRSRTFSAGGGSLFPRLHDLGIGGIGTRPSGRLERVDGLVFAEHPAHRVGYLAERAPGANRLDYRGHQVRSVARRGFDAFDRLRRPRSIALGTDFRHRALLFFLKLGIDLEDILGRLAAGGELVDADDYAFAGFDFALVEIGGVLNLTLHVAAFDRRHRPAHVVDFRQVFRRLLFELARQALDEVRTAHRIDRVGDARFIRD